MNWWQWTRLIYGIKCARERAYNWSAAQNDGLRSLSHTNFYGLRQDITYVANGGEPNTNCSNKVIRCDSRSSHFSIYRFKGEKNGIDYFDYYSNRFFLSALLFYCFLFIFSCECVKLNCPLPLLFICRSRTIFWITKCHCQEGCRCQAVLWFAHRNRQVIRVSTKKNNHSPTVIDIIKALTSRDSFNKITKDGLYFVVVF